MDKNKWDFVIKPERRWFEFNFKEVWQYRDLISLFVRRDFVAYYKQTILGPIWFFIQPIFTMIIFTFIFAKIAKIPTAGLPPQLFYIAGIINWNYFAECLNKTSNTFITNSAIFGKVYFPRLVVPLSIVISNLITYLIQFTLFLIILGYFSFQKAFFIQIWHIMVFFPLIILQMAILGLGTGIIVSSLTTRYKDLVFAVNFGVQLWMYATPIVYPMAQVPEKWIWVFYLNPMAPIIEVFRMTFCGLGSFNLLHYLCGWLITISLFLIGLTLFNRIEKSFVDTI